jgi:hypothetical protein
MKSFLFGVVSGIGSIILYSIVKNKVLKKEDTSGSRSSRGVVYDSPVNRTCKCQDYYCTCGRHVI